MIRMVDGSEKRADQVQIGDFVTTWNEKYGRFDTEAVSGVKYSNNLRSRIVLSDGRSGLFSSNHRLLTAGGQWKELRSLKPGEKMSTGLRVVSVEEKGLGPVVQITVQSHHTYVALGLVSHNDKPWE